MDSYILTRILISIQILILVWISILIQIHILTRILISIWIQILVFKTVTQMKPQSPDSLELVCIHIPFFIASDSFNDLDSYIWFGFLYQVSDQSETAEAFQSLFIATQSFGFLLIRQNNKYIKYESEQRHKCSTCHMIHRCWSPYTFLY